MSSIKNEIWKDLEGYEGIYQVSNTGKVRSLDRKVYNHFQKGKILKPQSNGHNYLSVSLHKDGIKEKHSYIHILVAKTFIPNLNNYKEVNHKDFNKENNNVENLEWVTKEQNREHYRKSKFCKKVEQNKFKKVETKTFKRILQYFEKVVCLKNKGLSDIEISKTLNIGKDFISNILYLYSMFCAYYDKKL